jgi:hypothetical protein
MVTINLILGTAFLDAYDHIEGAERKPILGVEVSAQFMKYQNWIYDCLNEIKCSVGHWMDGYVYLEHGNCVYIDPCVRDRQISAELPWLNSSHRTLVALASGILGRLIDGEEVGVKAMNLLRQMLNSMGASCVYRKSKSERIDDEVRPVWRANL